MFTQCPECLTVHSAKAKQLRKNRGVFRCKNCKQQFDALQLISEKPPKTKAQKSFIPEAQPLWEEAPRPPADKYWTAALGVALLLLFAQFAYFEGGHMAQNPALRPWLEGICQALPCSLTPYRNLRELEILHSSFKLRADQNYHIQAAVANRAPFAQAYPRLKLTLNDYSGEPFAERIFAPQDYRPQVPQALIASRSAEEIGFDIAAPETPVGGFSIELQ